MPSSTEKQARFMRAVAHGWSPDRVDAPPVSVAKEFMRADVREDNPGGGMYGYGRKSKEEMSGGGESGMHEAEEAALINLHSRILSRMGERLSARMPKPAPEADLPMGAEPPKTPAAEVVAKLKTRKA